MKEYPKTIIDEASGIEVPNPQYEAYMDGIKDGIKIGVDSMVKVMKIIDEKKLKELGIE